MPNQVEIMEMERKLNEPIFERLIYYVPYKSPEFVEKLQNAFAEINLKVANIDVGGIRALSTKLLTEEEKNSREFDFLSGVEIMDETFRLFIFEGLSEGAISKLYSQVPREEPNTD